MFAGIIIWKLGEEKMYETPQEYIEVMKKILANHPTNDAGQTTYAFTSDNQGKSFFKCNARCLRLCKWL